MSLELSDEEEELVIEALGWYTSTRINFACDIAQKTYTKRNGEKPGIKEIEAAFKKELHCSTLLNKLRNRNLV